LRSDVGFWVTESDQFIDFGSIKTALRSFSLESFEGLLGFFCGTKPFILFDFLFLALDVVLNRRVLRQVLHDLDTLGPGHILVTFERIIGYLLMIDSIVQLSVVIKLVLSIDLSALLREPNY
jgi:hypothetical protein